VAADRLETVFKVTALAERVMTPLPLLVWMSAAAWPHSESVTRSAHTGALLLPDSAILAQAREQPDSLRASLSRSFVAARGE